MECMRLSAGDTQIVHCREVVRFSECPLLEVPLYNILMQRIVGATQPIVAGGCVSCL